LQKMFSIHPYLSNSLFLFLVCKLNTLKNVNFLFFQVGAVHCNYISKSFLDFPRCYLLLNPSIQVTGGGSFKEIELSRLSSAKPAKVLIAD
jgi:hypothetical protein